MSTIKEIIDLATQLSNKIEDRKFAGEVREILKMAGNLQSEHSEIHEKNFKLMQENAELRKEIIALQQQKEQVEYQHKEWGKGISKEEEKILLLLDEYGKATADLIANQLQYKLTKTEYWLEHLYKNDMVRLFRVINQPTEYSLNQEGRKYLIKNELI